MVCDRNILSVQETDTEKEYGFYPGLGSVLITAVKGWGYKDRRPHLQEGNSRAGLQHKYEVEK